MGYDMYLVENDDSMAAEHEGATKAFHDAVEVRNRIIDRNSEEYQAAQALVERYYVEMTTTDLNHFRLNIWGMEEMRKDMHTLGMLAYEYQVPDFQPEDFGLTQEEWWADDSEGEPADERFVKARRAAEENLGWSPPDEPGIPVHKLGSNDGWVVTPMDIQSALAIFDHADREAVEAVRKSWISDSGSCYFDEWIIYLRRAQTHGGFRVY